MRNLVTGIAAVALCAGLHAAKVPAPPFTATPSGLQYLDLKPGKGGPAQPGRTCAVLYRGWLSQDGKRGKLFDQTQDPGRPFRFVLGQGQVIPGWDEGVQGMRPGGKRVLLVPPGLAYGDQGAGGVIPPGATLLFEVELLSVR